MKVQQAPELAQLAFVVPDSVASKISQFAKGTSAKPRAIAIATVRSAFQGDEKRFFLSHPAAIAIVLALDDEDAAVVNVHQR
jgi:hypothetical protein